MGHNLEIDPEIVRRLQQLRSMPERDPQQAAITRSTFLQEVRELSSQGISQPANQRHNMWKEKIQSKFPVRRKEQSHMLGTIPTLLLILGMIFGGSGVTVAAAQTSLPDHTLYPVKIWTEDILTSVTMDPEAQVNLALNYANRRAEELQTLTEAGQTPPEALYIRLQNQLEHALQVAANQPGETGGQLLLKTRSRLQEQNQLMIQLETRANPEAEAALNRAREIIQEHLRWVEDGLKDPTRLQDHLRLQDGSGQTPPEPEVPPINTLPAQKSTSAAPGDSGNPWTEETPTPGSGYGPGPGPDVTCTSIPGTGSDLSPMKNPQPAETGNDNGSGGDGGNGPGGDGGNGGKP
jgi:hypothetical protein